MGLQIQPASLVFLPVETRNSTPIGLAQASPPGGFMLPQIFRLGAGTVGARSRVSFSTMGRVFPSPLKLALLAAVFAVVSLYSSEARAFGVPGARSRANHPVVVGYFPQWGLYYPQPYYVKTMITNGSAARLDQINYAQGFVSGGRCSLADPNADLNASFTGANSVDGLGDDANSGFRGYFHQLL